MEANTDLGRQVLVVDDEIGIREVVRDLLECAAFRVQEARDGNQALQIIQDRDVAAILTDLRMPGMDGIEFVTKLRSHGKKTPVVFYSGFADKECVLKALRLGACEFIEKPFKSEELITAVKRACSSEDDGIEGRVRKLCLSGTQARVIECILMGKSNGEVAQAVGLAEPTVKYHVGNLLTRFEARNRTELRRKVMGL